MDQLFLCRPCIEKMPQYQTVERIEAGKTGQGKGTCDLCGYRRYGYKCMVEFKEATHSIIDFDLTDFPHFKRQERYERKVTKNVKHRRSSV